MSTTVTQLGRILLASLFIIAGVRKALAIPGTIAYINSKGLPMAEYLAYATIVLEIGGGLLLAAGILTTPVALAFAVFCLASGGLFHNFWAVDAAQYANQLNHFLKNVALAGALLMIAVMPRVRRM